LNAALELQPVSGGLKLTPVKSPVQGSDSGIDRDDHAAASRLPVDVYRVEGAMPGQELTGEIRYHGVIDYAVRDSGDQYARAFSESPGVIDSRGVYLAGSTYWVPRAGDALMTYTLAVELPAGWKSVSQGERTSSETSGSPAAVQERWSVVTPTEEVHLIAAPFTEYSRDAGAVKAMAFLRTPDQALADRYLDATAQYLEMYRGLLGPYPYSKFALVENFWETGYGMPSFTLLGEQIIRFPFILNSSYPHELLHNWWGNGVFVAPAGGNWCEGLTA
jgi:aminopeptidase N